MEIALSLPFHGPWLARNSPARRVPSHGTHLFATTYAMDFIAVRGRRTAAVRDWRSVLTTEPVERFYAYGRPILAPAAGRVVAAHDGVPDLVARRSQVSRVPYTLTQGARARGGAAAIAGNHVVLRLPDEAYVLLAHLRQHSVRVQAGDVVTAGQPLGECGNSGNSMQPHVHLQAMDAADARTARGLPMSFRDYQVHPRRGGAPMLVAQGIPGESEVVETLTEPRGAH
jgi:murein DD-endopeptidase MepM/ murein hydrolase activator NlpD